MRNAMIVIAEGPPPLFAAIQARAGG